MNITLIGMPGAGKSYVGTRLAAVLGYTFLDTDHLLEERFGRALPEVVAMLGEEAFLQEEEAMVLVATIGRDHLVISPGGSVVYGKRAMEHLRATSSVIFLDVPLAVLEARIGDVPRGIVGRGTRTLADLFAERVPLYQDAAGMVISGEGEVDSVVRMIVERNSVE